jgi:hypothetical protein
MLPCLDALFDEDLSQSISKARRESSVARIADDLDDAAVP